MPWQNPRRGLRGQLRVNNVLGARFPKYVNDASGEFLPPSQEERKTFRDALTAELGMPVVRRYSGGQDIRAGCGMLAGQPAPVKE